MAKFLNEVDKGLKKKTHPQADIKCFVTYVQDLPNGKGKTLQSAVVVHPTDICFCFRARKVLGSRFRRHKLPRAADPPQGREWLRDAIKDLRHPPEYYDRFRNAVVWSHCRVFGEFHQGETLRLRFPINQYETRFAFFVVGTQNSNREAATRFHLLLPTQTIRLNERIFNQMDKRLQLRGSCWPRCSRAAWGSPEKTWRKCRQKLSSDPTWFRLFGAFVFVFIFILVLNYQSFFEFYGSFHHATRLSPLHHHSLWVGYPLQQETSNLQLVTKILILIGKHI